VQIDTLLASILNGEPVTDWTPARADALYDAAVAHGVLPLVAHQLAGDGSVPDGLRTRLRDASHAAVVADLAFEAALRQVLAAFDDAAIDALVIKGSHLAYTHYLRPDLRSRVDTDLLIRRAQRDAAHAVLSGLGYETQTKVSGDLTATQALYVRRAHDVVVHAVDLHWRLASPQAFAHVLSFEELRTASEPLPALTPGARVPSPVHALLIACMHRVAHHHDEAEQFKWLFDIHLLASRFSAADWDEFVALAVDREVAALCGEGIEESVRWFRTRFPDRVRSDPRLTGARTHERTAAYLRKRSLAGLLVHDLRALPSWRARALLLGEHLLPPADYMRRVYAPGSRLPLPLLYVLRVVRGASRWLRRSDA
jgi:hypothetical protein